MKTIMAIGGHIGDAELTCGGTLATYSLKGYQVITAALTGGEKGNPDHLSVQEYRIQKEQEAKSFAEILGGISIVLPYNDGELVVSDQIKFEVAALIRQYKPEFIMTHWKNSMHKDHEATYHIVKDAQFYAGIKGFESEYPPHYASGPYYAENWEDPVDFKPYVYMEVSEAGYELWRKAIDTHWFALNSKSFKYKRYYEALMIVRGCEARVMYAEAFNVEELTKKVIRKL
jgi:LmbE family N-acetylglucosaminyl deacetylase